MASILPYKFVLDSDPENIEQEDRAEPLHMARQIKVVILLLLFVLLKHILDRISTTA